MRRDELFLAVLAATTSAIVVALIAVGEVRADVYVMITSLTYFILAGAVGVGPESRGRPLRVLNIAYALLFATAVTYRVWKTVSPAPHPLDVLFGGGP